MNVNCGGGSGTANLNIDVDANIVAQVQFGYTIVGSLVPLKLDDVRVLYLHDSFPLSDPMRLGIRLFKQVFCGLVSEFVD